ncbi:hypothetical protein ACSQ67_003005 [Phaseolus vulgaris]
MAAGWNAQLIVETWSQGGLIATSIGLAVARSHTCGRHVCVVPDERARSEYAERMGEAGVAAEIVVGEAEEAMGGLVGVDFLVADSRRKDFPRVLRLAKLSNKGAVLLCKNANSNSKGFLWRSLVAQGSSRRVVRSAFLPVGKGLDMAYVSASGVPRAFDTTPWNSSISVKAKGWRSVDYGEVRRIFCSLFKVFLRERDSYVTRMSFHLLAESVDSLVDYTHNKFVSVVRACGGCHLQPNTPYRWPSSLQVHV